MFKVSIWHLKRRPAERRGKIDMKKETSFVSVSDMEIQARIATIRNVQVMLDRDLATLYGVEVKQLNRQVKRNIERFPSDFMFQLTKEDCSRCQIGTLKAGRGSNVKYLPYAFTENGIAMLSGILKSPTAIDVNIRIMRAFVAMRRALISMSPVLSRVETVERRLVGLEDAQTKTAGDVATILDAMRDKKFPPQKVFFDGEFFDAFAQMKRFVRQAKRSLVVIDPYFDDTCLPLIAQKRPGVAVTVVRSALPRLANKLPAADIAQFNKQYGGLAEKRTDKFHDRYLIIDHATLIHVGASLNHLGKRCFAFSTLASEFIPDILARVPS